MEILCVFTLSWCVLGLSTASKRDLGTKMAKFPTGADGRDEWHQETIVNKP